MYESEHSRNRQEEKEFKASINYTASLGQASLGYMRPCLNKATKIKCLFRASHEWVFSRSCCFMIFISLSPLKTFAQC